MNQPCRSQRAPRSYPLRVSYLCCKCRNRTENEAMKRRKDVRKEIQCRFGAWHVAQMKSLPRVSTYGTSPDEKSSQGGHPRREQIQEAKSEAYGPAVRLEQKINEKQATLAMGGYNVRGRGAIEAFFTKRIIATLLICTRSGLSENEIWSAKELFSSLLRSFQSILHR